MSKLLIAPDLPQWLLDEFNQIDYKSKKMILFKSQIIKALVSWANQNIPRKISSKTYQSTGEIKKISPDFDKQLLDVLNSYDYTALTDIQINLIKEFIGKYKHLIPIKKVS